MASYPYSVAKLVRPGVPQTSTNSARNPRMGAIQRRIKKMNKPKAKPTSSFDY